MTEEEEEDFFAAVRRVRTGLDAEPNGIRYKLDVLDARNTGMRELRARRAMLEDRQRALEEAVL